MVHPPHQHEGSACLTAARHPVDHAAEAAKGRGHTATDLAGADHQDAAAA